MADLVREYEYQLCNQIYTTNHDIQETERICGYNEKLAFEYLCKQLNINRYPKDISPYSVIDNY